MVPSGGMSVHCVEFSSLPLLHLVDESNTPLVVIAVSLDINTASLSGNICSNLQRRLSLLAGGGTFLISIGSGKGREQLWSMQYGPLQFSSIEHELGNFISSKLRLLSFFSP